MSNEMNGGGDGNGINNPSSAQRRILEGLYSKQDEKIMDESVIHYVSLKNEKLGNSLRNQLNVTKVIYTFSHAYFSQLKTR
jgi:hypothetical protein